MAHAIAQSREEKRKCVLQTAPDVDSKHLSTYPLIRTVLSAATRQSRLRTSKRLGTLNFIEPKNIQCYFSFNRDITAFQRIFHETA